MFRRPIRPFAEIVAFIVALAAVVRLRGFPEPMRGTLMERVIAEEAKRLCDQSDLSACLTIARSSDPTPLAGSVWAFAISTYRAFCRLVYSALDHVSHALVLARLPWHERIAGPAPEKPEDRAIREERSGYARCSPQWISTSQPHG